MAAIRIGQTVLDQFRVEQFIAAGGMGAVYRVWDLQRNTPLAMKVLHADLADDPSYLRRFQREADALQQLAHPNIVPFYGIFQTDDAAFLLTAFVDGPSLKDLLALRKGRPLDIPQALTFLRALSAALGYAHHRGVIHSDVKPGNVMLDQGGSVFLTDFGIARSIQATSTTIGSAGTPSYMAPEQIRGEVLSPAADIYALGILLFELLTGRRPFRGDEAETQQAGASTTDRIVFAHLHLPSPPPSSANPFLPASLDSAVLRSLVKDPGERYPDTQSFFSACLQATDLSFSSVPERIAPILLAPGDWEQTYRAAPPPPTTPPPPITPPILPNEPTPQHARTKWLLAGIGIVALILLFFAGSYLIRGAIPILGRSPATLPVASVLTTPPESQPEQPTLVMIQPSLTITEILMEVPTPTVSANWQQGKLTFIIQGSSGWSLYTLDLEQSDEPHMIASPPVNGRFMGPAWSPDGVKIALYDQYSKDILVVDVLSSSEPVKLADGTQPGWSSDGSQIIYRPEGGEFAIINALSGTQTGRLSVPAGANLPDWSPMDDSVIYSLFASDNATSIWIQPFSGGSPQMLAGDSYENYAPSWSHDGNWIAYQSDMGSNTSEIWVMERDGKNPRRLTFSPADSWSRGPTWSPDDQWLAFVSSQADSTGADFGEVFVVPATGGEPIQITETGGNVLDWRVDWGLAGEDPRQLSKPYSPLPDCARSRLRQGDWAFVSFGGGHNDIRSTPDTHPSDNVVGEAQEGELLLVLDGPECNFGWILWEVQTAGGFRGWTPESDGNEFWLDPFPSWNPCTSAPPSDLVVGELALVAPFPPDANKVRQQPGSGGSQIGTIQPGERVEIMQGPACEDNIVWWWIRSQQTGLEGWTAEGRSGTDWLIPTPKK